jgi:hypothetical protein
MLRSNLSLVFSEQMVSIRILLAAVLASLPLAVFAAFAFVGIGSIGFATVFLGLTLSVPFWLLLVLPLHLLSGRGRRWSLWLTVIVSYLIVAMLYTINAWTPSAHTLVIGGKVLVQEGVATSAYYNDLFAHVAAAGVAVMIGIPIFARLIRRKQ